ncbi:hypothetical protein AQUCO_03700029v1 [Aquilegia coerulea]|uniref:Uncharacterized protein n=1 Tax=Aquilegia coerulea TaxID=218851 RepID=A0A2G5CT61_AQUCA|nr:hypothetical protein AQUCO_03700029v1 [Aquilegia coerulea]
MVVQAACLKMMCMSVINTGYRQRQFRRVYTRFFAATDVAVCWVLTGYYLRGRAGKRWSLRNSFYLGKEQSFIGLQGVIADLGDYTTQTVGSGQLVFQLY